MLCSYMKANGYWIPLLKLVKMVAHFTALVLLLFIGTLTLANVEDYVEDFKRYIA